MLSNLFRPKWQHKNVDVRLQAIANLKADTDANTLQQIALNDSDAGVRHAAISRINKMDALKTLFQQTAFNTDKAFIQQCWCAILADNGLTNAVQAESIVLDCNEPLWLAAIVQYCSNDSLQKLALTGLRDEELIFKLLNESRESRLWQLLVQQLESEDALKRASQIIKGRDKKTSQILRQRLDAIAQQQQAEQEKQQHIQQLRDKLQHLLDSDFTPLFEGIVLNAEQQIQQLTSQGENVEALNRLLQQCQAKLQAQQSLEIERQTQQALLKTAQQLQQRLQQSLEFDEAAITQLAQLREETDANVQLIVQDCEKLQQALAQFEPAYQASQQGSEQHQLQALEQAINACQLHPALKKKHLNSLQQQQSGLSKRLRELQKQQKTSTQDIDRLVQQADDAILSSDFDKVKSIQQQLKKAIAVLEPKQAQHYQAALQRTYAATQTLHDWQEFATDPKREALCEQMQQLIDDPLAPVDKSNAIKELQNQWKQLGYCKDQALWQRFQALADQAYAPCKAYFAEQKAHKQFNAEQCQVICQQVEQFAQQIDWSTIDYRSLDKLLHHIDQEWKKYNHLERKDFQALQQRYFAALAPLKDKLKQQKQKNIDALQNLVNQALQLIEMDNANDALSQYQALHEKWKNIGISFHKKQQELWQQLRQAGDAIYQKRTQQRNEAEEELQANLQQAQTLITAIQQSQTDSELDGLKQQFEQLGSLPKNAYKKVQSDYHAALKQFQQQQRKKQQQAFFAQIEAIQQWQTQCVAQELAGETCELPEAWSNEWKEQVKARFNSDISLEQAKALLIEAEIFADIASPAEDENLRMNIQMQQLQAHFGNANKEQFEQRLLDLVLRWAALPLGKLAEHASLNQRFNAVIAALSA